MAELTPQTREEHFLARIASDPNALVLEPVTRIEHFLQKIIDNGPSPGPGGEVTPASVVTATGQMTAQQAEATLGNIGGEPKKLTVIVTESSGTYAANKTFSQMWTAYNTDHKTVTVEMGDTEFVLSAADPSGMAFTSLSVGSGNATLSMLAVDENDDWNYAEFAAEQKPTTVTVSGTTPTITPTPNTAYNCGELTSLTVSNPPAAGSYSIVFTSGSTPTVTTFPASILGMEDFAAEANTLYEINVLDGRAVYAGWPLPASE